MELEPNQGAPGNAPAEETGSEGPASGAGGSPLSAHEAAETPFERPEVLVATAFVGGFAAAQIVKWLGRR